MNRNLTALAVGMLVFTGAHGAPLLPLISGPDFNFGGWNGEQGVPEWNTMGAAPDTLVYTQESQHEVTALWPNWPQPPVFPVFDLANQQFGGDLVLGVKFTGQDAPQGPLDVSLTGTGLNDGMAPDLLIFGTTMGFNGLLWALDLEKVSFYGYSDQQGVHSYVLEGIGTIVGGLIPDAMNLIGKPGAMRGHVDLFDRYMNAFSLPQFYDPMVKYASLPDFWRAAYSGETGQMVPEPSAMLAGFALMAGIWRRRKR